MNEYLLLILKTYLFLVFIYGCLTYMSVCTPLGYLVPTEASRYQIPWN